MIENLNAGGVEIFFGAGNFAKGSGEFCEFLKTRKTKRRSLENFSSKRTENHKNLRFARDFLRRGGGKFLKTRRKSFDLFCDLQYN